MTALLAIFRMNDYSCHIETLGGIRQCQVPLLIFAILINLKDKAHPYQMDHLSVSKCFEI